MAGKVNEEWDLKSPYELALQFQKDFNNIPSPKDFINATKIPPPHIVVAELHQKFLEDGERIRKNMEQFPILATKSLVSGGQDLAFGITNAPLDFVEDTTKALLTFTGKPVDVLETVLRTPAHLLNNLTEIVDVALKESLDMKGGTYKDRATKARTVTDFIPFI